MLAMNQIEVGNSTIDYVRYTGGNIDDVK